MNPEGPSDNVSTFHATGMSDLQALTDFVDAACQRAGAEADAAFAVRLAVEEAFVNILHHGYADQPGPIDVGVTTDAQRITITLHDKAPLFDPAAAPAPDVDAPLDQRQPGGLGLHLIRQMMDTMDHQPGADGGNTLTLVKRLC